MIKVCESIFYNSLNELHETYKPNHPDVLRLKKSYGSDVQFNTIMHRENVKPRFELLCFKVVMDD